MIESIINWGNTRTYEYAGFTFLINGEGKLVPAPGQHRAAYKQKHRMNAQSMYEENNNATI